MRNYFYEIRFILVIYVLLGAAVLINAQGQKRSVKLVKNEASERVDVLIDGRPFTSYIWTETLKKPILYPILSAGGTIITRGFPLDARAGESVDHPHQVGLWFNYGDVNGVDFWNNSTYRRPEETARMGTIVHRRIVETKNGETRGELTVEMDWLMPDGKQILREATTFIFRSENKLRSIDRLTRLTALEEKVVFNDNKEGLFGLRVCRELEQPTKEPIRLTDAGGKASEQKVFDNTKVTGEFRSSEGKIGDEVWGTRGKWAMLSGQAGPEPITILILDHPKNVGFPTYWMARGYGLFAANPLGQKVYSIDKKEPTRRELKFTLGPRRSVTFRYRLLILSETVTPEQVEAQYRLFSDEKK
jgi:hypothetical protein